MLEIPPHVSFYFQLVLFLVFAAILRALIWTPMQRVLADREHRTTGAQAEADRTRDEVATLQRNLAAALEEARQAGGDAAEKVRRAAEAEERQMLEIAHAEAVHLLEETRERLQVETEAARAGLQTQAEQLARLAAERILGRPVST
jgi:F-type H+-transporting ATPase subunit b